MESSSVIVLTPDAVSVAWPCIEASSFRKDDRHMDQRERLNRCPTESHLTDPSLSSDVAATPPTFFEGRSLNDETAGLRRVADRGLNPFRLHRSERVLRCFRWNPPSGGPQPPRRWLRGPTHHLDENEVSRFKTQGSTLEVRISRSSLTVHSLRYSITPPST